VNPNATVHFTNPRDARPGTGASEDLNVLANNDGKTVAHITPLLKTRARALRYWRDRKVIEIRDPELDLSPPKEEVQG
jgi:hypothetical protein